MAISYYKTHEKTINKVLQDYKTKFDEDKLVYNGTEAGLFHKIRSNVFKYVLRYYQMEALYMLDYLLQRFPTLEKQPKEIKNLLEELMEKHGKENPKKIPFLGFEMATGSGKTALMGACIYYLNEKFGIKNFLIITPSSLDIYQKTIRNFTISNKDSIWAKDTIAKFNLITGDDYNHLFFDETKSFHVFVFNINKFGANAKNTAKAWESSYFRDGRGNTISVKEYLEKNDLVIITDEAHHSQSQKSGGSGNIIKNFDPKYVLEFTATALENPKDEEKRAQKIVYILRKV